MWITRLAALVADPTLLTEHGPLLDLAFGTARPDRVSSLPWRESTR